MRTFLKIKNSRKAVKGGYFKNDSSSTLPPKIL